MEPARARALACQDILNVVLVCLTCRSLVGVCALNSVVMMPIIVGNLCCIRGRTHLRRNTSQMLRL